MPTEEKRSKVTVIIETDGVRKVYLLPAVENLTVVENQGQHPEAAAYGFPGLLGPVQLNFSFNPVRENEDDSVVWYSADSSKLGPELAFQDLILATAVDEYLDKIKKFMLGGN